MYDLASSNGIHTTTQIETAEDRELESLEEHSKVILPYLRMDDVNDVAVNDDGKLWIKSSQEGWQHVDQLSVKTTKLILRTVATIRKQKFDHENPILETVFPLDGSRISGIIPPVVSNVVLSIRTRPKKIYKIYGEYVEKEILTFKGDPRNKMTYQNQFIPHDGLMHATIIELAVKNYRNILIVGSTGSGKTTLMNGVIDLIGEHINQDRLVVIEDTPELQSSVPNTVYLLASSKISLADCLVASLRLNPDRILVGEVRRKKPARVLLESWNTGHSGGIATIHADNALKGLYRLEEILQSKSARPEIARAVNLVVFIDGDATHPARRKVRELMVVKGLTPNGDYDCVYV